MFNTVSLKERFEQKVVRYEASGLSLQNLSCDQIDLLSPKEKGCHVWTSATVNGYGVIWVNSKLRSAYAHRLSYVWHFGGIPEGLHLDHLCRTRSCVNPMHLQAVSCGENILRGKSLQALNKAKTHCVNGHEFTSENTIIRKRRGGGRKCRICRDIGLKKLQTQKKQ